jgi:hypothetical protein
VVGALVLGRHRSFLVGISIIQPVPPYGATFLRPDILVSYDPPHPNCSYVRCAFEKLVTTALTPPIEIGTSIELPERTLDIVPY